MSEGLDKFLELEHGTLDKPKKHKKLKNIIENLIDEDGWDRAIKDTLKLLFDKKYSDEVFKIVLGKFHQYNDLRLLDFL